MDHLALSIKKRYFIFIILLIILLFSIVFLPVRMQLKQQAVENYNLLAESKLQTISELISAATSSARSLSSRTAIRDLILEHKNREITWSELEEKTHANYIDGIKPIQNLEFAVRYVGNNPLVEYHRVEADISNYTGLFGHSKEVRYKFETQAGDTRIIAYSPILYQNELIGSDVIVVNITEQMQGLAQDGFQVEILKPQSPLLKNLEPQKIYEKMEINQHKYICVAKPIHGDYFVFVSKLTNDAFQSVNRVCVTGVIGFAMGLLLIFFVLQVSLVNIANGVIQEVKGSRDTYMNYANFDALTGAYTRVFFDTWMEDKNEAFGSNEYVIGMVDVDRFKIINDTCGHETGDEVLKFITDILMTTLRENDFVFRFGGDEFVVIFENINTERVARIFSRIEKVIEESNPFEFDISISYGIEAVKSLENIYDSIRDSIRRADEKMYHRKRKNRNNTQTLGQGEISADR